MSTSRPFSEQWPWGDKAVRESVILVVFFLFWRVTFINNRKVFNLPVPDSSSGNYPEFTYTVGSYLHISWLDSLVLVIILTLAS